MGILVLLLLRWAKLRGAGVRMASGRDVLRVAAIVVGLTVPGLREME